MLTYGHEKERKDFNKTMASYGLYYRVGRPHFNIWRMLFFGRHIERIRVKAFF